MKELNSILNNLNINKRWLSEKESNTIKSLYNLVDLELSVELHNDNKYIMLDIIKSNGKGSGTKFMNDLISWADKNNKILTLSPTDKFVGKENYNRLINFYKNFGFIENNRKLKLRSHQTMVRIPNNNECSMAAPTNTIGMGNPTLPTDTEIGSGDTFLPIKKIKKKRKMKKLTTYITEHILKSRTTVTADDFKAHKNTDNIFQNNADCKGLPPKYLRALVDAWYCSAPKSKIEYVKSYNANEYFKGNGKKKYEADRINYAFLFNKEYPVLEIKIKDKAPKRDALYRKLPVISMPLVLTDDDGLFTEKNTTNLMGNRDLECYIWIINRDRDSYTAAVIYKIHPNATKKLLAVKDFHANLKRYYKMNIEEQRTEIVTVHNNFYKYILTDKHGYLDISDERKKETEQNKRNSWKDTEQEEEYRLTDEMIKKIFTK